MATRRPPYSAATGTTPLFSPAWFNSQLLDTTALLADEVEDIAYQTRGELEWLNDRLYHALDPNNAYVFSFF